MVYDSFMFHFNFSITLTYNLRTFFYVFYNIICCPNKISNKDLLTKNKCKNIKKKVETNEIARTCV